MNIYVVTDIESKHQRLVRAVHRAQAIRHVAQSLLAVKRASQDELVRLVAQGAPVESAVASSDKGVMMLPPCEDGDIA